jgi:predicted regulator of Ras-like GTPase activity (Roadblock/LC7/MglB family)
MDGNRVSATLEQPVEVTDESVSAELDALVRYEEILGVLVVSVEGLVMGSAGLDEEDAEFVSVLGASLVGVAERTTRRLGAGSALALSIHASDGLLTLRNGGAFALLILSEHCETARVLEVTEPVMQRLDSLLSPV